MSVGGPGRKGPDNNSDHRQIYKRLKVLTVDYRFRPGEQLMVAELAERLRVGSTPIREALIRLQTEALLDTSPRRGFFAKTLNLKEMIDLFQLRFFILKSSIEHASDTISDWAENILPGVGKRNGVASTAAVGTDRMALDQLDDDVRYVERVSERVAGLSHNEIMVRTLANANDRTHYVRLIDLEVAQRLSDVRRAIEELCSALLQKDAAAAVTILKSDLEAQIDRMSALVKEGISRAYTSPSWILMPSQIDTVPLKLSKPVVGEAPNIKR